MKIAIIGAGTAGLACAIECEKLGLIPDIFEKDDALGWPWIGINFWPTMIYRSYGDVLEYIRKTYDITIKPLAKVTKNVMKSSNKEVILNGNLGYYVDRGRKIDSLENQLFRYLRRTAVHMNTPVDYKELKDKYDWVVIATGREKEARELNVWEDQGGVRIIGAFVSGTFEEDTAAIYMNTEYSGTGYGRLSPLSKSTALAALYIIGKDQTETIPLFDKFLEIEGLNKYEILYHNILPPFTTGRVKKFKTGNILLTGRSAGLVESFLGTGAITSMISGIMAARATIQNEDYDTLVKPLQDFIDNVSSFRPLMDKCKNKDFNNLLSNINIIGVKQSTVNIPIDLINIIGGILKNIHF